MKIKLSPAKAKLLAKNVAFLAARAAKRLRRSGNKPVAKRLARA